jgi:hypothetical protein
MVNTNSHPIQQHQRLIHLRKTSLRIHYKQHVKLLQSIIRDYAMQKHVSVQMPDSVVKLDTERDYFH